MQNVNELKHLSDDEEIERIAALYRPVHAPERRDQSQDQWQDQSRPELTLHTTRRNGVAITIAYRGDWFGAYKLHPAKIERATSRYCRLLCAAKLTREEQGEEPDHAA